jgi:hypothetical protein
LPYSFDWLLIDASVINCAQRVVHALISVSNALPDLSNLTLVRRMLASRTRGSMGNYNPTATMKYLQLTRSSYVESLRRRVAELEQKVNTAEQKHIQARRPSGLPEAISPITGKRRRSTEAQIDVGPGTETSLPNGDEQSTVEDTMSAIGLLSNKAMAESRVNTSNEPHKLSIIESISAALAVDGRDPSTASTSQHTSLIDGQLIPLTRDLTLSHMQRFINWGVWLPYIDEDHLMEHYNKVLDRNEQIGNPGQAALPHFNTYLAIAIGISMSPDTNRFSALAMNLHAEAVKLLPSILHSQEPLDTLHCMLLLAVFSMFSPSGGSTWHLMGFIMTNCIASGLHKTAIPQARLGGNSNYRVEWLFWTVHLWDRFVPCRDLYCSVVLTAFSVVYLLPWVDLLVYPTMIFQFL